MSRRYRMRVRKRTLGSALAILGVMVWAMPATLRLAPDDHRGGGASVVGGIILLAAAV
ncbi:MAG TPA: hypothetical protein VJ251_03730 [Stellaceae bacterium]|jgi:hypothetical protein|nr:hypothetical protein [Stellaceae bacterium]